MAGNMNTTNRDITPTEIIEHMQLHTPWFNKPKICTGACDRRHGNCVIPIAADLLEAAIADIPHNCVTCWHEAHNTTCPLRTICSGGDHWIWRG